jgi:hypothetical protein
MENDYKNFVATFYTFLHDINRYVPDSNIEKLLPQYNNLDMVKVLYRIHKLLKSNEEFIKNNDVKLFNQGFLLLPSINLSLSFGKMNPNQQKKIWTYLNMLLLQTEIFYDNSKEEFNPYVGVGNANQNYNVTDMLSSIPTVEEDEPMDISRLDMMMKMMGLDKMLDMSNITNKLKDMTDEDLERYTEELKIAFGGDSDPNVSNFVVSMMGDLTNEIKKGEEISLPKMLHTLGPKIQTSMEENNLDNTKLLNSAKNFAKQHKNNGGAQMFGGIDPFAMLEKLTGGDGPVDEKQCLKECGDMLKQVGLNNINPENLQGMSMSQMLNMMQQNGSGKNLNPGKRRK